MSVLKRARGVRELDRPEKEARRGPPQLLHVSLHLPGENGYDVYASPPLPFSHALISDHALSLTALWMGTIVFISVALGS